MKIHLILSMCPLL
uniref:Uncharacterized protein n=1 Tax=Anguilla anguilla TaxID=7936 RepID=A0A0E9PLV9_ANGAN